MSPEKQGTGFFTKQLKCVIGPAAVLLVPAVLAVALGKGKQGLVLLAVCIGGTIACWLGYRTRIKAGYGAKKDFQKLGLLVVVLALGVAYVIADWLFPPHRELQMDPAWEVTDIAMSPDGHHVVFTLNDRWTEEVFLDPNVFDANSIQQIKGFVEESAKLDELTKARLDELAKNAGLHRRNKP